MASRNDRQTVGRGLSLCCKVFGDESRREGCVARKGFRQDFECDEAIELRLSRLENAAPATLADASRGN